MLGRKRPDEVDLKEGIEIGVWKSYEWWAIRYINKSFWSYLSEAFLSI